MQGSVGEDAAAAESKRSSQEAAADIGAAEPQSSASEEPKPIVDVASELRQLALEAKALESAAAAAGVDRTSTAASARAADEPSATAAASEFSTGGAGGSETPTFDVLLQHAGEDMTNPVSRYKIRVVMALVEQMHALLDLVQQSGAQSESSSFSPLQFRVLPPDLVLSRGVQRARCPARLRSWPSARANRESASPFLASRLATCCSMAPSTSGMLCAWSSCPVYQSNPFRFLMAGLR